jgi:hypothetical protein
MIDSYNPLYSDWKDGKIKDTEAALNEQNQIYGAHHWYPLLTEVTPKSYLFQLAENNIKELSEGVMPTNAEFVNAVENLISSGYRFMKTTHKSAHAFKPITNMAEFEDQILNPQVIMSFRRYHCQFLMFRTWAEMNLECRVYVYEKQVKYVELYRDEKNEFKSDMFPDIIKFVSEQVIPKLESKYDAFTADVYLDDKGQFQVVEINSPLCGTYLVKYDWEKERIHTTTTPICRYKEVESGDVIEL